MGYDDEVYEKILSNYELLCNIIRQSASGPQLKVDLSKIGEIINKKIPDTLKKNAPEDFYELYTDFKSEYEKFRDFILYDKLIGKNIIALGGGFSSGKSSFLNALMGKMVLPADIDPSTSVPTYIVSGEKHNVMGINVFDNKVQMQPRDIKKIAHGFGEVEDDDDEKVADAVTLGHVLENIFFSTPLHKYDNIAFLDTPGYSKPDSEKYSAKTDEQIARGQLNSSNYILWFVQADAGTITEEDIKFIKTLREDIPKLIIVNKADKKNLSDLKDIIAKIKSTLDIKGIRYVDVFPFTSRLDQVDDDPDYEADAKLMATRKNMTLVFLWNRYSKKCSEEGKRFYQYRQYCELYNKWCEENYETAHFDAVIAQKMEVDFAGQTFAMADPLTGEILTIVVFVAILPYSQYIYAEGMLSTKEPQWIEVNNHALDYFGGVPALVVCDNCKQAVIVNQDWIEPELNKDYADWADHYGTVILPAKVRKPKFKSSVENAVGILEKGFFHKLEERQYFSLEQFNKDLWKELEALNKEPFKKKEHNRYYYWEEEKLELMPLPSMHYEYMERKTAKVSSDFHVRFDNAYYSVDKAFLHKKVSIKASSTVVRIYSLSGEFLYEWPRATRKQEN